MTEIYLIVACDECSKEARVRQVLERSDRERVGDPQLRAEVENCLRRMNIDTAGLDALSPQEMAELELILGSGDPDSEKREQAQRIIGQ